MASYKHPARRSLRLRLLVLLLVPLLSLAALWVFAAYLTTGAALGKYETSTTFEKVAEPGFVLMATLQQERLASAVLVSPGGGHDHGGVTASRTRTDGAEAMFRRSTMSDGVRQSMTEETRQRLDASLTQIDGLSNVRAQIDSGTVDALGAINDYDAVIDGLLHMFDSVVLLNDQGVYQQGTAILNLSVANEFVMREDTLVSAALSTPGKRLTGPEYTLFARSAANGRYLFDTATANLPTSQRGPFDRLAASADFNTLRSMEDGIVAGGARASLAPRAHSWRAAITPTMKAWLQATDPGRRHPQRRGQAHRQPDHAQALRGGRRRPGGRRCCRSRCRCCSAVAWRASSPACSGPPWTWPSTASRA